MKIALLVLASAFALVSCNTVAGMGRDLQSFGGGVSNTSQKTSEAIDKEMNR